MLSILAKLNDTDSQIKGSAVTSKDGLALAYSAQDKPDVLDEDKISAMGAALFATGNHCISKLVGGKIKHIIVEGEQGHVLLTLQDDDALLITVTQAGADTEAILQQMISIKDSVAAMPSAAQ
ncbi:MAG: roadblock/LC7 domain-containing protein [Methylococcales bacterium]|nr:roadblock/LC7 domain-containing protein [Methylococcales bacterium]